MRTSAAVCALAILTGTAAFTADSPAQILFNLVREKILANIDRVPRYTCVETVTRVSHVPQYGGNKPSSCAGLIAAHAQLSSPGLLAWHDRLRLDVAVGKDSEIFSWAGAASFETTAMNELAGTGATGSGAFSSFLASIFGADAEQFRYIGEQQTPLGTLATFEYTVPQPKSHYTYHTGDDVDRIIGYHGTFYAIPSTAALRRLQVVADHFPGGDACQVIDTMDYTTVKIGSGDFLLPEISTMEVLYTNGVEARNETHFSGCREYVGESTIRFDDADDKASPAAAARAALKALPPKTRIRVNINPPINTETAAAGDPITGVVEREVKEKGQVLVRTTDRLHGRLLRLEQTMVPIPKWTVAIRFDSIERDGVIQPVTFKPLDDGDKSPQPAVLGTRRGMPVQRIPAPAINRPPGTGVYILPAVGNLILDQKFHTDWETK